MFDTKEQDIIKYGLSNGKSKQEVMDALTNYRLGIQPTRNQSQEQTFLQDAGSDIKQTGTDIKNSVMKGVNKTQQALDAGVRSEQGALQTTGQIIGQGADVVSNIFGDILMGVAKTVLPQSVENAVKTGAETVTNPIVNSQLVKSVLEKYNQLDEVTKRNIEASLGIAKLGVDVATLGGAKKAGEVTINQGAKVGKTAINAGKELADGVSSTLKPVADTTSKIAAGIKDVAQATGDNISKIPGRIATNVAETKVTAQAIKQLPTKIAKDAVGNGIDIADVKYLYKIPTAQKKPLQELFKATKDFVSGTSKTNPIEIVGKPIIKRISNLKTELNNIGQKLGNASESLGNVTNKELIPTILSSLQKVPGLNGLKLSEKGMLDFTDTVLASGETLTDRKSIQRIFNDAIKTGTGKQKHLLRQELFEVLGGKKKALVALTETQDKAYQAIRQGISNVLDTKNNSYKLLNSQYSKVVKPLNDISRFMKLNKLTGAGEDILNMDAGLLVRRLTSNASSNPEIRNLLRSLDNATKVAGKTTLSVENLQDFYNVLDKYYDIAGKTTFQGQIQTGVEKATGFRDALSQAVGQVIGKSDAVKRKAIEDAISEALK